MNFWNNKRVFITGHTGFKGSWLCLWLSQLGARVTGYSIDLPTNPSLFAQLDLKPENDFRADIRDAEKLKAAMQGSEIVFHLAAQPLVKESYLHPSETFYTNVTGTVNLLEAVRVSDTVRSVVAVTTDKCYENLELSRGYRETDPLGGHDPYAASKACAELVAASYRKSFSLPVATARAGNVIGGGDWASDRIVPDIIRAWSNGETVILRHPEAVRPWQHVLEPLCGYMKLAEALYNNTDFAQAWNFGPNATESRTVEWLVSRMQQNWGSDFEFKIEKSDFHETNLLLLDSSKAAEVLWTPKWAAEETVARTARWYMRSKQGESPAALCLEDIWDYEQQT